MTNKNPQVTLPEYEVKEFARTNAVSIHAVMYNMIIASAECERYDSNTWWVSRVILLESRGAKRGQGLGSRLLKRMLELAQEAGAKRIIVTPGGYNTNQEQSIHFYEKNGFVKTAEGYHIWFINERKGARRKAERRCNNS